MSIEKESIMKGKSVTDRCSATRSATDDASEGDASKGEGDGDDGVPSPSHMMMVVYQRTMYDAIINNPRWQSKTGQQMSDEFFPFLMFLFVLQMTSF